MKTKQQIKEAEENKVDFIIIDGWAYETKEHDFNKTYNEVLSSIPKGKQLWNKEDCIKLHEDRRFNLKSCWFWIESIFKNNSAWFDANLGRANLNCDGDPTYSSASLGVRYKWKIGKAEKEKNKDKIIYTKIPELGIEISNQVYNDKTYPEILKLVKEEQIVTHDMLLKLRSLTDKYPQFKNFWVFCPNPDLINKKKNYVAGFYANARGAGLGCSRNPADSDASLGCFIYRRLKNVKI